MEVEAVGGSSDLALNVLREAQRCPMTYRKRIFATAVVLTIVLGFAAPSARADLVLTLGQSNLGSGYTGPFAKVTIADLTNSATATVTFEALNGYLLGREGVVGLSVNDAVRATNPGKGDSLVGWSASTLPLPTDTLTYSGLGNEDGFGTYNFRLDGVGSDNYTKVVVTLTKYSGTWTNANNVLTPNSDGYVAATHIIANVATGVTGFATTGGVSVPDGGTTVLLLGMALGVGGLVFRSKK